MNTNTLTLHERVQRRRLDDKKKIEERAREVIDLYTNERLSYAEIGRRIGRSRQRAKQIIDEYLEANPEA